MAAHQWEYAPTHFENVMAQKTENDEVLEEIAKFEKSEYERDAA